MIITQSNQVGMKGNVLIQTKDALTNEILSEQRVRNLVTVSGCGLIAKLLEGTAAGPYWIAIGTGSTAATLGDTALEVEVLRVPIISIASSGPSFSIAAYIGSGLANGYTIREVGLFNAASGGTLFARAIISSVVKNATTTINISWSINITSL